MKTAFAAALVLLAPAALAQEYVNIGEYQGGFVETPAPYETVPLPVAPAPTYAEPVVYNDVQVMTMPAEMSPIQTLPVEITSVETLPRAAPRLDLGFASDMGMADPDYEAARLAAYDTDGDGTITTAEAIATLKPLGAPSDGTWTGRVIQ